MSQKSLNLGILVSGNGSNLQAIIDACEAGRIDACVAVVISDNPGAFALERARKHNIPCFAVEKRLYITKQKSEEKIIDVMRAYGVELICLAGFMRVVGKTLLAAFPERIINIHPALLPAFPGLDAQGQAWNYGVRITGCTVHFVDEKIDHGPIILQAAVAVKEDDTLEVLRERILKEEHRLYPEAIRLIAEGKVIIEGRKVRIR